jgi:hypothetical protein
MTASSSAAISRTVCCLFLLTIFLILSPAVRAQSEFDEAHTLLEELSRIQQEKRDQNNAAKLAELMHSVPQRVQQLLSRGIVDLLNTPIQHTPDEIHQKLTAVLQAVPPDVYQPEVFVFPVQSRQEVTYLIAYNIVYCVSCSRGWLGVVGRTNGLYEILTSDDNAFPNQSLAVVMLWPTGAGKPRFLVHGTNWGDAHNRLTASVYILDDNRLKSPWSLTDLPQGAIKVTPTEIIVSFLTALVPPWSEKTEIYSILPEQIKLRQSFERANP